MKKNASQDAPPRLLSDMSDAVLHPSFLQGLFTLYSMGQRGVVGTGALGDWHVSTSGVIFVRRPKTCRR